MEMIKNFVTAISNVANYATEPVSAEKENTEDLSVSAETKITEEQEQMLFNTVSKIIDTVVTSVPRPYVDVLTLQLEKRGYLFKESGLDIVYDGVKIILKFIFSLIYQEMSKDESSVGNIIDALSGDNAIEDNVLNKLKDIIKCPSDTAVENTAEQPSTATTTAVENTAEQPSTATTTAVENTVENKNILSGEFKMEYFESVYGLSKEVCTRNAAELKVLSQSNSFKEFDKLARGKMPIAFERNNKVVNVICDGMTVFMIYKDKDSKLQAIGTENLETVKSLIKVATAAA